MIKHTRHFETAVSHQWGGKAKVSVVPTAARDYVVEIRPHRSRRVVRAELGVLVEIVLERDAKARVEKVPTRKVRRSLI